MTECYLLRGEGAGDALGGEIVVQRQVGAVAADAGLFDAAVREVNAVFDAVDLHFAETQMARASLRLFQVGGENIRRLAGKVNNFNNSPIFRLRGWAVF